MKRRWKSLMEEVHEPKTEAGLSRRRSRTKQRAALQTLVEAASADHTLHTLPTSGLPTSSQRLLSHCTDIIISREKRR